MQLAAQSKDQIASEAPADNMSGPVVVWAFDCEGLAVRTVSAVIERSGEGLTNRLINDSKIGATQQHVTTRRRWRRHRYRRGS